MPTVQYNNKDLENAENSAIQLQLPCDTKPMAGRSDGFMPQQGTPTVGIPAIDKGHSRIQIIFVNLR